MAVTHLWILYESGLCILEDVYITDVTQSINETLMGGFIAALFSFSKSFSEKGIDSMSMGTIEMHYAVGNGIITCIAMDKSTSSDLAKDCVKRIHESFLGNYSNIVKDQNIVDINVFLSFKSICREILSKENLLSAKIVQETETSNLPKDSEKVRTLIRKILDGENPKQIAEELRSIFTILGDKKERKEFNKILIDFDKFITKLEIEKQTSKQLLALTNEIRSFATINEWLG